MMKAQCASTVQACGPRRCQRAKAVSARRSRRSDRRGPVRRSRRLVPARLRPQRLRLRDLRRVHARHQPATPRVRRARVRRPAMQPARHRPRHRGWISRQNRRHPLDRCPPAKPGSRSPPASSACSKQTSPSHFPFRSRTKPLASTDACPRSTRRLLGARPSVAVSNGVPPIFIRTASPKSTRGGAC
jgi:hypothetical protein